MFQSSQTSSTRETGGVLLARTDVKPRPEKFTGKAARELKQFELSGKLRVSEAGYYTSTHASLAEKSDTHRGKTQDTSAGNESRACSNFY